MSQLQMLWMVSKVGVNVFWVEQDPQHSWDQSDWWILKIRMVFFRSGTVDLRQRECVWLFIHFPSNEPLWGANGFDSEELEDARPLIRVDVESYDIYSSQDIPIPIFVFEYVYTLFITWTFFIFSGEGEKKTNALKF